MSKGKEPRDQGVPSTDNEFVVTGGATTTKTTTSEGTTVVSPTTPNAPAPTRTFFDKSAIRAVKEGDIKDMRVPEWDVDGEECWIRLRLISARERDAWEASMFNPKTGKVTELENLRARFVVLVASDEQGNRMFADSDIAWLTNKSAGALDRIDTAGKLFNGMKTDDIDDAEKN